MLALLCFCVATEFSVNKDLYIIYIDPLRRIPAALLSAPRDVARRAAGLKFADVVVSRRDIMS